MQQKVRNEKILYTLLTIVLWVIASFALWEQVCELSHEIGAIVSHDMGYAVEEISRMLPCTLLLVAILFSELFLNNAFTASDVKARVANWKIMGFLFAAIGIAVVAYVCIRVATGGYLGFIEGSPTALYPLDTVLLAVIMAVCGFFFYKYAKYIKENGSDISYTRSNMSGVLRAILRFLGFLGMLLANYAFASCVYSIFEMDFVNGGVFLNICVFAVFLLPVAMFYAYRFVYLKEDEENRTKCLRKLSAGFLIAAVLVMLLYIFSSKMYFYALSSNCPGLFPVDNISSTYLFPVIYGANNILTPAIALACNFVKRADKGGKSENA